MASIWENEDVITENIAISFRGRTLLAKFGRDFRPVLKVSRRTFLEKIPHDLRNGTLQSGKFSKSFEHVYRKIIYFSNTIS